MSCLPAGHLESVFPRNSCTVLINLGSFYTEAKPDNLKSNIMKPLISQIVSLKINKRENYSLSCKAIAKINNLFEAINLIFFF